MNTLIRHIEYLISRHDCVIIPEFGALLATEMHAQYNFEDQTFMPPHRVFTFNGNLRHDDRQLVTSVQRAENISYQNAHRKVYSAVEALQTRLRKEGELPLGAVGTLYFDEAEGTVTFTASDIDKISVNTLWLPQVEIATLPAEQPMITEAPIEKHQYSRLQRAIKVAASIAILLGIGFVASTPMPVDDAMLASLAPEISQLSAEDYLPEKESVAQLNIIAASHTDDSTAKGDIQVSTTAESANYYIIVATLANRAEAEKYLAMHPGQELYLMERGKYYTVYSSIHTDVYEAYRACNEAIKTYPGAWVCKK